MLPHAPWLVWAVPIAGALLTPILARVHGKLRDWFAFLFAVVSSTFALSMLPDAFYGGSADIQMPWIPHLSLQLGVLVDPLSVFMACIVSFIGALILLYSIGYMAGEEGLTRYYFFMLLFIGGMIGLVMADNLLQLYIFWEVVGLCSYALIGFWYKRPEAVRAGMKAFIVTRVGDVCLLAGILMLYLHTGTFAFSSIREAAEGLDASTLSTVALLMFGGAVGKSAQFPLFVWLPDAMEGPATVSALIHAATMVKAGVYLVARMYTVFPQAHGYLLAVAAVGSATALLASTMALTALDIKRVLAYSTISQIGYMMFALGLGSPGGWFASQFHLMSHALFKALLFLCAGAVIHAVGTRDMRRMGGLRHYMPITYSTFLVGVLSLSAIPPFNGFWSKDLILEESYGLGGSVGLLLFLAGTLTAAVTVAYSIRMLALVFLGEPPSHLRGGRVHEAPRVMTIPMVVLAVLCVLSGFLQAPLAYLMSHIFHSASLPTSLEADILPLSTSLLALAAGGLPAYLVYVRRIVPPERFTHGAFLGAVYRLLLNGYYVDWLYHRIFVNGVAFISERSRRLQTGILNFSMLLVLISLLSLLGLLLMS